ncbi:glutaminase [Epilithonimonas ginsengisoli]|uniref:Glutaminase n=1 Tax=Epilithonimonas ginsengisoli TaxID=1245592 RepID=A0ABU4JFM2_9FLAO|nr:MULTISPECIES: glutaminase [Chryseobacterium group]MBV6879672.1 glutaminase [Epilithonimonas sp. FP105]MDW8548311.1 glutaminase [Epilithonimonas ginsengisoli]OAH72547.1 glutaminase A [Chryseobacterium sp. FP211-J200]
MNQHYQNIIETIFHQIKNEENPGEVASYIPELANEDPEHFAVSIQLINEENYSYGDHQTKFSIQSISKVLLLCLVYRDMDEKIWERVDVEPSGNPFNSLVQLESDNGIPRNPFLNAGALVITDILIDLFDDPKKEFLAFVRDLTDSKTISYSETVAESELKIGFRNAALCNFIKSFGNIKNDPEDVLNLYSLICSVEMTTLELCNAFTFLANGGKKIIDKKEILTKSQAKRVNAIMQTCGFYDESGEFSFRVGLPGKSGVGGGIVALFPGRYVITVWSPKLNPKGNSYRGMKFLEQFTTATEESIF